MKVDWIPPEHSGRITLFFGVLTTLTGIIGLVGLATGFVPFRSFFPEYRTMAFSTALILVFFGMVIMTAPRGIPRGTWKTATFALLGLIAVLQAGEILSSIGGSPFLSEAMMVRLADQVFQRPTVAMSPVTAAIVLIAAIALFILVLDPSRPSAGLWERNIVSMAGIFVALAGLTILLGYAYHVSYLNGELFTTTAAPTAVALTFLGISLTAAAGRAAIPLRYFTGTTTTAVLLRSFVPLTIAIVIVQGFFHDIVDALIQADSRALIFSGSIIFFSIATGVIVGRTSGRIGTALEEAEAREKAAEQELTTTNEELTQSNEELSAMGTELEESIDQLRRNEQALLESRQRLENTQMIAGLGSWDLDLVNNRLTWSDEVYRIFGLEPQGSVTTYETFLEAIHPDDRDAVNTAYSRSLVDGSNTYEIDHRIVQKSTGEVRYVHEKCDHVRNGMGAVVRSTGMVHDITARKEAENRMVKLIASWNATFNAMNDQVCLFDRGGRIELCNAEMIRFFALPRENLVGRTCRELLADRGEQVGEGPVERMLGSGTRERSELAIGNRWFAVTADPILDTYGTVAGGVQIFRDVTEQKRLEMEMINSLQEKEVLLKEIHHRVKNNIQVISSILNLQSGQARDASTREIFQETQNKVKGIALIHEKLYRNKSLSRIDYAEYLRDISSYTFQSYNVDPRKIGLRIDAGDVAIDIDRAVPLSLIVTELLSNALKHAFPGGLTGEIFIGIHRANDQIVLEFSDNGIGLPASVTFDKGDTLGMGLLAGLTRQLNGGITIDRSGGTSYTITFPAGGERMGHAIPAAAGTAETT